LFNNFDGSDERCAMLKSLVTKLSQVINHINDELKG